MTTPGSAPLDRGSDLAEALKDLPLPACWLDKDGMIYWQNTASLALQRLHVGSNFADVIAAGQSPEVRNLLITILCNGEPAELALPMPRAKGSGVLLQLSAVPVLEGGAVVASFGLEHIADT